MKLPSETTSAQDLSIALARLEYLENKRLEHIKKVSDYQKTAIGRERHRLAQQRYREKKRTQLIVS